MVNSKNIQAIVDAKKERIAQLKKKRFGIIDDACRKRDDRLIDVLKKKLGI